LNFWPLSFGIALFHITLAPFSFADKYKHMSPLKIQIIIGSTRQGRFSDKPAYWIEGELKKAEGVTPEIVDLKDYPLPFYDNPVSPMWLNGNYSDEQVKKFAEKVKEADAFIIIAPEYNHGYTAVLKNAIDHLYPEWNYRPVTFISFGGLGGARVVEQLRQVAVEIKMIPTAHAIHVPIPVYMAAKDLQVPVDPEIFNKPLRGDYVDHVDRAISELVKVADATRSLRGR
jgi:NAD(P)H-dependent FMN reductase